MALPTHHDTITGADALELLDQVVADRGAKHRYPTRAQRKDGVPAAYFGEPIPSADWDFEELTPEQQRDASESGTCHYFATERDAALIKSVEVGAPMCIVGFVLAGLGMTAEDIGETLNVSSGIELLVESAQLGEVFDERAQLVLATAQEQQDGGLTWGDAVANARSFFEATAEE